MTIDVLNENPEQPNVAATDTDPYQELLENFKREDGSLKYATPEAAIKALAPTQEHISTLEAENAQLREQAARAKALEEMLEKLQPTAQPDQNVSTETPTSAEIPTEDQIKEVALQAYRETTTQQTVEANRKAFNSAVTAKFGTKAKEEFAAALQASGFQASDVQNWVNAGRVDFALDKLGLTKEATTSPSPGSTVQATGQTTEDTLPDRAQGESNRDYFVRLARAQGLTGI